MFRIDRAAREARWFALTRDTLPGMARLQAWPVSRDHCFMRICLDTTLGVPWTASVEAPAIRNMSDVQLAAAIAVAERCVAEPDRLPVLNAHSIEGRRRARTIEAA